MNAGWWGSGREPVRLDRAIADTLPGLVARPSSSVGAPAGPARSEHPGDDPAVLDGRVSSHRLVLPRWDTAWEIKRTKKGTRKHRRVWDVLHLNARPHWRQRHRATTEVIEAVVLLARQQGLHRITGAQYLAVELVWSPGDRRKADAINLAPLTKVCVDALARGRSDLPGLHLVPDDSDDWCEQRTRIVRPPEPAGLWLDVEVTRG